MAVSGEATGTGKSLMQSLWMIVFKGEVKTTISSITEAQAFEMLASGENIYGNQRQLSYTILRQLSLTMLDNYLRVV